MDLSSETSGFTSIVPSGDKFVVRRKIGSVCGWSVGWAAEGSVEMVSVAGGSATKGLATGGSATKGSATGGSATGGSAAGGSATGGSAAKGSDAEHSRKPQLAVEGEGCGQGREAQHGERRDGFVELRVDEVGRGLRQTTLTGPP